MSRFSTLAIFFRKKPDPVLEQLNLQWFEAVNAAPDTAKWAVIGANLIAKRLILIFPLLAACCWLWGPENDMVRRRAFVCKAAVAVVIGLTVSGLIGLVAPHERPFVLGIGTNFSDHDPTPSFPSNHGTIVFTFAFAFLFWLRIRAGLIMMVPAFLIAWSRIYLGVHWPLDMVGAFLLALAACGLTQFLWAAGLSRIQSPITRLYRLLFAPLIRTGRVRP